jgi:hypothetical protein
MYRGLTRSKNDSRACWAIFARDGKKSVPASPLKKSSCAKILVLLPLGCGLGFASALAQCVLIVRANNEGERHVYDLRIQRQ